MAKNTGTAQSQCRILVTSFSNKGYEQYGRKFLDSWEEHWRDVPLVVFHEGKVPETVGPVYLDLLGDPDVVAFHQTYGRFPEANGVGKTKDGRLVVDYRWQATKFARKVFAITSGRIPEADWRIWIDADVVFKRRPDDQFWEKVTPEGYGGTYIGRDSRDWHHSECGWVAYRMPESIRFLDYFRSIYATGHVFKLGEWHDSYVWDRCRKDVEVVGLPWKNLAESIRGMHPWPETILGQYMTHYKGPVAKKEFYGSA